MDNLVIDINGTEYALASTLRVAYLIQGQHNHKPYSKIFEEIGDMCLEDQIGILYCAFKCANPEEAKQISRSVFENYYLDNYNLGQMFDQIQEVIKRITGEDFMDKHKASVNDSGSGNEGN